MDVTAYIKELLNQEQFVYVPGLGTFLTRKTAGVYNAAQQRFYPPENKIDFLSEEKKDATLENYISRQKNISPTAASYFIEKFVDQLRADAADKNLPVKEVLFPAENTAEIGNKNQKNDTVFNQENFGLPVISLPVIKKEPDFTEKKEAVNKQDYVENFYREFSNNLPDEPEETNAKKSTGFWAAILLLLAICVLGCYALYLYYPDIYSRFIHPKQSVAVIQKPKPDSVKQPQNIAQQTVKADTVQTKATTDTTVIVKKTTVTTPASVTKTLAVTKSAATKPVVENTTTVDAADPDLIEKSPYEIIGAAFKTLKGAKKFLNQLKDRGMHAKILKTNGKSTLITFGSYPDKETAQAALEKLRAKDVHSEAYIQHYLK